jgi:hypothetical protein
MYLEAREKKRGRFRRVSRTRIFEGHLLKVNVYAVTVMVLASLLVTSAISLLFSYFHGVVFSLVLWTLLPGALLGYALLVMERALGWLKEYMFTPMGNLLTAFLLFFAHAIAYLALSSIIVSYPLGYVMEELWALPGMAGQYSLFSVNFFIVLSILSWLRNVRTPPCKCL